MSAPVSPVSAPKTVRCPVALVPRALITISAWSPGTTAGTRNCTRSTQEASSAAHESQSPQALHPLSLRHVSRSSHPSRRTANTSAWFGPTVTTVSLMEESTPAVAQAASPTDTELSGTGAGNVHVAG